MKDKPRQIKLSYIDGYADGLRDCIDIISDKYPGLFGQEFDEVCENIAGLMTKLKDKKNI